MDLLNYVCFLLGLATLSSVLGPGSPLAAVAAAHDPVVAAAAPDVVLRSYGHGPGAVVAPAVGLRNADGSVRFVAVVGPPRAADAKGEVAFTVPVGLDLPDGVVLGAVDVAKGIAGGNGGGWGPLTIYSPVSVGGWVMRDGGSSYDPYGTSFSRVARDINPGGEQVSTLWAVLVDHDGSGGRVAVQSASFDPANHEPGINFTVMTTSYNLSSGHVLELRLFDHEPSSSEIGSGGLVWDSVVPPA